MSDVRAMRAPAKVNLSLRVSEPDGSGRHPILSLAQAVGWYDELTLEPADSDNLDVVGADLPVDGQNLVWKAIAALRRGGAHHHPVAIRLRKRLPIAAGLGGGSSDAAAALLAYRELTGFEGDVAQTAAEVGSDVPFCLVGGTQWMEGHGERLTSVAGADDYWLVIAVPPFELSAGQVYDQWDRLGGPQGTEVPLAAVPPSLRGHGPFVNDLYAAAVDCNADLDDWRHHLEGTWDRPVALSGSGPSLFAYFADADEAQEALALVPTDARHAAAAAPIPGGAQPHGG